MLNFFLKLDKRLQADAEAEAEVEINFYLYSYMAGASHVVIGDNHYICVIPHDHWAFAADRTAEENKMLSEHYHVYALSDGTGADLVTDNELREKIIAEYERRVKASYESEAAAVIDDIKNSPVFNISGGTDDLW